MTDHDLMQNLRTLGEALDRSGERAMGPAVDGDDGTPVLSLLPAAGRSRRGPVWFGAAAAVVALIAGTVAVGWPSDDGSTDVAAQAGDASILALVPGDLDAWEHLEASERTVTSSADPDLGFDHMVLTPAGDDDPGRVVVVSYDPRLGERESPDGELLTDGSGLSGRLYVSDGFSQLAIVHPDQPDVPTGLTLIARESVEVGELFGIAARVDPDRRFAGQVIPGWEIRATYDLLEGRRAFEVTGYHRVPLTYDSTWVSVSTYHGTTDDLRWLVSPIEDVTEVQVRGGATAWMTTFRGQSTAVWTEAPGVVVIVTLSRSSEEPITRDELLGFVEELETVDRQGWEAFATAHSDDAPEGGATTTVVEDSESAPLESHDLTLTDEGQVCWSVGRGASGCDEDAEQWRDGTRASEPRIGRTDDGEAVLLYGFLPEGAAGVEIGFHWSGRAEANGLSGMNDLWGIPVPTGARTASVRYLDDEGRELAAFDVELVEGG